MVRFLTILLVSITFSVESSCYAKGVKKSRMLHVESLSPMLLEKPLESGRPSHVSAASGIVELNGRYYINADDEVALFSWKEGEKTVTPFILEKRELGAMNEIRKKFKPDYESLLYLDEKRWPPHGALLVWPSASTEVRLTASLVTLNVQKKLEQIQKINIQFLAEVLSSQVSRLNIEGLSLYGDTVYMFNRGNGRGKNLESGYFEMPAKDFLAGLNGKDWPKKVFFQKVKVGKLNGVKLALADGLWTKYGFLGLAPAEDSADAIADGAVMGTVLVRIDGKKGRVIGRFDLDKKFEGFSVREVKDGLEMTLVDDADDPMIPSHIYRTHLSKKDLGVIRTK